MTFETNDNYSIRFEMKKKHYSHSTSYIYEKVDKNPSSLFIDQTFFSDVYYIFYPPVHFVAFSVVAWYRSVMFISAIAIAQHWTDYKITRMCHCRSVCLSTLQQSQFWLNFNENLHRSLEPKK